MTGLKEYYLLAKINLVTVTDFFFKFWKLVIVLLKKYYEMKTLSRNISLTTWLSVFLFILADEIIF